MRTVSNPTPASTSWGPVPQHRGWLQTSIAFAAGLALASGVFIWSQGRTPANDPPASPEPSAAKAPVAPPTPEAPREPSNAAPAVPAVPQPTESRPTPPPGSPEAISQQAESLMTRGQHLDAYNILQGCLAKKPDNKPCSESLDLLFLSGFQEPLGTDTVEVVETDRVVPRPRLPPPPDPSPTLELASDPLPPPTPEPAKKGSMKIEVNSPEVPSVTGHRIVIRDRQEEADIMELGLMHKQEIDGCIHYNADELRGRGTKIRVAMLLNHEGYAIRTMVTTEEWRYTKTALCLQEQVETWKVPRAPGPPRNGDFTIDLIFKKP